MKYNLYPMAAIAAFLLFSLFILPGASAQSQISGKVVDKTRQPLAAATVMVLSAVDSTLVHGMLSDQDGRFLFSQLDRGNYLLRIQLLGFSDYYSSVFAIDPDEAGKDLGELSIQETATALAEVGVVAKRPFLEQKIDRMVVNVANSAVNAGGNALQVLQRSPGVQVNALTKTISLAGKAGVIVMINNKVSHLPAEAVVDMLSGMNADNIDRIELIHTPPANFDAEGNAGIINIILKKSADEGLNGGYSLKAGYGRGGKYGGSMYFNYRKNKLNFFGSYDHDYNLNPQVFTNYRQVVRDGDVLETESYSDRPHTPTTTQNARLGADFQVSKKTVVGVLTTFFDRNWYMEAVNAISYKTNGSIDSLIRMPNSETNHSRSLSGNVNLAHNFSSSSTLTVDADFIRYDISNPSHYDLFSLDGQGNTIAQSELRLSKKTPIDVFVAKSDFSTQLWKNAKLETGAKYTTLRFDNEVSVDRREQQQDWSNISSLSAVFHLNEDIAAGYANFSTKIDAKTDLQASLRYEHTDTNLGSDEQPDVVDRHYGSWFPAIYLNRNFSASQSLNLSYSRRIMRPSIRNLAPWLIFADPTTVEVGNPALQPAFSDAFNLAYGIKTWRLNVSYSITDAPIRFVPNVNQQNNTQQNTQQNLDNEKMWYANLSFPLQPVKWWEIRTNMYGMTNEINFTLEGRKLQVNNSSWGINVLQTFKLPRKYSLELSGDYNSPGYWGIGYWKAFGSLNIGVEKDFGERWGKLRLNATDLLSSMSWFGSTNQPEIGLKVKNSYQMAERTFMLSWVNTFGNKKLKSQRQRQTGSAEEMNRI